MKKERMIQIISFFLQLLFIKCQYDMSVSVININDKEVQGMFYCGEKIYIFIEEDNIYQTDLSTSVTSTCKVNTIKSTRLSLKLIETKEKDKIIGFGEELLYFVDDNMNEIGTPVKYEEENIDIVDIYGNTILEILQKSNTFQILIGYQLYNSAEGGFQVNIVLFDANKSDYSFTKKGFFPLFGEANGKLLDKNFMSCLFIENGDTIICSYINVENNESIDIGIVNENFDSLEKIENYESLIDEIQMRKINENAISIIYHSKSGNEFALKVFNIKDRIIYYRESETIKKTFSTDFFYSSNNFLTLGLSGTSLIILNNANGIGFYQTSIYDEIGKTFLSYTDLSSILPDNYQGIPSYYLIKQGDDTDNGFIVSIVVDGKINLVSIPKLPSCHTSYYNTISNNLDTITVVPETETDYLKVSTLEKVDNESTDSGNVQSILENGFIYQSVNSGNAIISYSLIEKTQQILTSPICRMNIRICHWACDSCSIYNPSDSKTTCEKCANGYAPLEDDETQCESIQNGVDNYFYEAENSMFLKCNSNCLRCSEKGTNSSPMCTKCTEDKYLNNDNICKCDKNKSSWYQESDLSEAICVKDCPTLFPYLNEETNQCLEKCPANKYILDSDKRCVDDCPKGIANSFNECIEKCPEGSTQKGSECIFEIITDLINNIDDIILELAKNQPTGSFQNSTYQIYNTSEAGKKEAGLMLNVSTIDLGECETKLKEVYNIPQDEHLLMFKLDISREGQITNQVEYSVYNKNGDKLDLSYCKGINITISTPINQNEKDNIGLDKAENAANQGYDIYDPNDKFYTDLCTPFTSEHGSDVIIKDRKLDYFKNVSFCEEGCDYKGIDFTTSRVNCSCDVKDKISEEVAKFSFKTFGESFTKMFSNSNLKVFRCYKMVFNFSRFLINILGWVVLGISIMEIILIAIYIKNEITPLVKIVNDFLSKIERNTSEVNNISRGTQKMSEEVTIVPTPIDSPPRRFVEKIKNENTENKLILKPAIIFTEKPNHNSSTQLSEKNSMKSIDQPDIPGIKVIPKSTKKVKRWSAKKIRTKKINNFEYSTNDSIKTSNQFESKVYKNSENETKSRENLFKYSSIDLSQTRNQKKKATETNIVSEKTTEGSRRASQININIQYTDEEINGMEYEEALKYEHRTFCHYYYSILKYDQSILFAFFTNTDFNLKILKIAMFIFSFVLYLIFNAFFYSDATMTHNYQNSGKYDFVYGIPSMVFSFLCCYGTLTFLSYLALSQPYIQQIKEEKDLEIARKLSTKFVRIFKLKISIFFTLVVVLLGIFWYYLSAFGAIYKNTQANLLLDTLNSFIMCNLYPFILCFITTFIRFLALKYHWKKVYCFLYWFMNWFSNCIQMF